jgi:hypothetical protein
MTAETLYSSKRRASSAAWRRSEGTSRLVPIGRLDARELRDEP